MIKLNDKEGRFNRISFQKKTAVFSPLGLDNIKYFNLEVIKKIQILKGDWVLRSSMNQVKIGFKKGIDIRKAISWFSVYFVNDRKNNDREEISSMQKKYITTLMITPIIGSVIGGAWGLINHNLQASNFFEKRNWQILLYSKYLKNVILIINGVFNYHKMNIRFRLCY